MIYPGRWSQLPTNLSTTLCPLFVERDVLVVRETTRYALFWDLWMAGCWVGWQVGTAPFFARQKCAPGRVDRLSVLYPSRFGLAFAFVLWM